MEKTKKLLSLLLCLVLVISLLPVVSAPATALTDGDWEYTLNADNEAFITKYLGTDGNVSIPFIVGGYPGYTVTSVGDRAFFENTSVISVTFPAEVTAVGEYVFNGCENLKQVIFPLDGGLKSIGDSAFGRCSSLTTVTIPSTLTSIGGSAFYGCSSLSSLYLRGTLKTIPAYLFQYCGNLKTVGIPKSVTMIANGAFADCTQLATVYYGGNAEDRTTINITSGNDPLNSATWIYRAATLSGSAEDGKNVLNWTSVTDATKYMMYRREKTGSTWGSWEVKSKSLTGTTWTDSNVTGGVQYEYKLRACVDSVFCDYSNVMALTGYMDPALAVLSGTAQAGKNLLSWTKVTGATKYMMYRREKTGATWSSWTIKTKSLTGLSWEDSSVTAGTQYEYKLRACVGGVFGGYSNVVGLTAKAPVTLLTGEAQPGKNLLSWTAVSGASKYMMYRREKIGSTWGSWTVKTKSIVGTTWTDTNVTGGVQYEYKLRACVGGVFGDYSNTVGLTGVADPTIAVLSGEAQPAMNVLSWTKVTGATKYMMYRREKTGATWGSWEIKSKSLTGLTWTDSAVTVGAQYEYKLRACVGGVFGGYSNVVALTAIADPYLAKLSAEGLYTENMLAWTAVPGATSYRVFRRVNSGGGWGDWTPVKNLSETNWSDTDVTADVIYQYQYRVRAYADGAWRGYSNIELINSPGEGTLGSWVTSFGSIDFSFVVGNEIAWSASADTSGAMGLLEYRFWIYRDGVIVADSGYWYDSYNSGWADYSYMALDAGQYTACVFIRDNSMPQIIDYQFCSTVVYVEEA